MRHVADCIRDKIVRGEITSSDRIDIEALSHEFNVSKIPVREALLVLKNEGLVTYEPVKGASAVHIPGEQLDELFALKKLLASQLLAASLPHITDEKLNEAKSKLSILTSTTSSPQWSEASSQFFECLYSGAKRPKTLEFINTLSAKTTRYDSVFFNNRKYKLQIFSTFRKLIEFCSQKHVELAINQLQLHIEFSRELVKQACNSN